MPFVQTVPVEVSPAPSTTSGPEQLVRSVGSAASWFQDHRDELVTRPLQILLILVLAIILRWLVLRVITRTVTQVAASPAHERPAAQGMFGITIGLANERRQQRAETIAAVLRNVASVVIVGVAIVMVLGLLGLNLAPILASAGIVGVAVGFGAQSLVKDFISGIFMILEDQYGVGDLVDVGDATGTVEDVGLRVTTIRDFDGVVWYVRNGEILRVGNKSQGWSRAIVDIPVDYSEDISRVKGIMERAAAEVVADPDFTDLVLEEPTVMAAESVGGDGVMMRVTCKTYPGKHLDVARELRIRLKEAFDAEEVRVSTPLRLLGGSAEAV